MLGPSLAWINEPVRPSEHLIGTIQFDHFPSFPQFLRRPTRHFRLAALLIFSECQTAFPPSCWVCFQAGPLRRCVIHGKFANLLSFGLLVCKSRGGNANTPRLFWQWSKIMDELQLALKMSLLAFPMTPCFQVVWAVCYTGRKGPGMINSLLIWCLVHPTINGSLWRSLLLPNI